MVINPGILKSRLWKSLSGSKEAVLVLALLVRADKNTMRAFPTIETLAQDTRTSSATIRRAIRSLERKHCLTIIQHIHTKIVNGHNEIRKKNEYDLSMWKKYCRDKKREKKIKKQVQNERSQSLPQANNPDSENGIVNAQIDHSQDEW